MTAPFLLILSAVFHAGWNTLVKKSKNPRAALLGVLVLSNILGIVFAAFYEGSHLWHPQALGWNIIAGVFEGATMIALALVYEAGSLGRSYIIMRGGAMIFVWLISSIFLHEITTPLIMLGATFVFFGLAITQIQSSRVHDSKTPWAPYLCAIFIAGYHLAYGKALSEGAMPMTLFALSMLLAVPVFVFVCGRQAVFGSLREFRQHPLVISIASLGCALSFIIFLFGLKNSGAGMAITLRNTSIVFVQIFSLIGGERVSKIQWLGAILVTLGAGLMH